MSASPRPRWGRIFLPVVGGGHSQRGSHSPRGTQQAGGRGGFEPRPVVPERLPFPVRPVHPGWEVAGPRGAARARGAEGLPGAEWGATRGGSLGATSPAVSAPRSTPTSDTASAAPSPASTTKSRCCTFSRNTSEPRGRRRVQSTSGSAAAAPGGPSGPPRRAQGRRLRAPAFSRFSMLLGSCLLLLGRREGETRPRPRGACQAIPSCPRVAREQEVKPAATGEARPRGPEHATAFLRAHRIPAFCSGGCFSSLFKGQKRGGLSLESGSAAGPRGATQPAPRAAARAHQGPGAPWRHPRLRVTLPPSFPSPPRVPPGAKSKTEAKKKKSPTRNEPPLHIMERKYFCRFLFFYNYACQKSTH